MNILIGTLLLWTLAGLLWLKLRAAGQLEPALAATGRLLIFTGARMVMALLGAAFVAELLPEERIQAAFGHGAGLSGVLFAAALGPITPGGGFVSFAVAAAALRAGAAPAPVLAYVTAWSLFSATRFIAYELPLIGARPAWLRVAVSWPVPLMVGLAGLVALH